MIKLNLQFKKMLLPRDRLLRKVLKIATENSFVLVNDFEFNQKEFVNKTLVINFEKASE